MNPRNLFAAALLSTFVWTNVAGEAGIIRQNQGSPPSILIVHNTPIDPDPHFWTILINLQPELVLNESGDLNGDGEPCFGFGELPGLTPPTIVWAKQVGTGNHDPVYAQYLNGAWGAPVMIASHPGDDHGPKWWQDAAGTVHTSWWRAGPNGSGGVVLYAKKTSGSSVFSTPETVSQPQELARGASMIVLGSGEIIVIYETDPVLGSKKIVVASKATANSVFQPEIIATTTYLNPTEPAMLSKAGHDWVVWVHSNDRLGYSEKTNGVWSAPAFEPYLGAEDKDRARIRVQNHVLAP